MVTHVTGHPSAAGRAHDGSLPVKDRRSTTVPRDQPFRHYHVAAQRVLPRVSGKKGMQYRHAEAQGAQ